MWQACKILRIFLVIKVIYSLAAFYLQLRQKLYSVKCEIIIVKTMADEIRVGLQYDIKFYDIHVLPVQSSHLFSSSAEGDLWLSANSQLRVNPK